MITPPVDPRDASVPRILLVTSQMHAVGGIPTYVRSLVEALRARASIEILDLDLSGGRRAQLLAFGQVLGALVRHRPDLLLLGHVGFGPIGLAWRSVRGRYVVIAYGMEIWGRPTRELSLALRLARGVWPISTFTRSEVLRVAPAAKVSAPLGGAIAPHFFQDRESFPGPARVLFVASLRDLEYKGADTLIDAVGQLKERHEIELRVIGDGPGMPDLRRYVSNHDAESYVTLVGRIGEKELLEEYRRGEVLVLLSRFRRGPDPRGEGLGLVVLEAGASGIPAIASTEGGARDTVIDGETGYLVRPGDVGALATRLDEILSDRTKASELGTAARDFVQREHSVAAFTNRVAEALELATS